ncbi:LytTR family DNA-binding domain-containing protein [Chitinophaga sancti]|uniref:LytTR family DNA-binding domain-containing protein n=2 Tax=Chitinophaga sancti TaxID=1004 RepID=A0ABZ0XJL7_9BACT|nr:LytTR family DNA-binding domain-containing protein [Chitinophaga sancti]WQD63700.1 LytTR family DNA-binding domain-containing protein [Chitinophaga sancti]WQG90675.1 LytTR family DNA-binding domain-containing protein [Chitinophaga sancti]
MNILIIEDEPRAAKELKNMVQQIDDTIQVLGILESVEQAKEWFSNNAHPDLILSDIQLADGLSFEIYSQVKVTSAVIFCTAFDEYLMTAFETNAVSYLLKPVTIEKLEKALEKYESMKAAFANELLPNNLQSLLQVVRPVHKTALLVNEKEKIIPVQVKDIACIYLDNTILQITTLQNKKYYITATMEETERLLDPAVFFRANRQYLINKAAIGNAERYFARKLVIRLTVPTEEQIVVSKAKAGEFLQWLEC